VIDVTLEVSRTQIRGGLFISGKLFEVPGLNCQRNIHLSELSGASQSLRTYNMVL